ncbi:MauE/DoxX family redox-associated membrane protein [Nitrosococcus watsonii]|uniref:Methylamine utilization protein MauE n=1 Tax=Nitrosococcus watsoni (strain C-113) TaxID=105559 RepID=D8K5C4_NITWC|nr:MauE/DoxX family redox-associated membrane protein [Nitrosococcus watsonii]ADJ28101.1 conserved hypothetical protein [Nitrosococcus watsonii C-113]
MSRALSSNDAKVRDGGRGETLADYWPLISLVGGSALAAWAIADGFASVDMRTFMHAYMGVFLLVFALLKIFNLNGFQDGFVMYDLLAKRVRTYGYVYPFIELALAIMYLNFIAPELTYWATVGVFSFGAIGVVIALRQGLDINCPCMGSVLSVPLSTVTLTEDIGMLVMALLLLFVE